MNPQLDLSLQRIIRAPRSAVWNAWTDPSQLERWWIPAPVRCRVEALDVRPGGAFVTRMSEDGREFTPHLDACFIDVEPREQIVFTTAIDHSWRPASPQPVVMTATITLHDHPEGTDYRILVQHGQPADRRRHEELGFAEGWGTVVAQLARLTEGEVAR